MEGLAFQRFGIVDEATRQQAKGLFGTFLPSIEAEKTAGEKYWAALLKPSFLKEPTPAETLQTTETFGVYLSSWETLLKQSFLKEPTPAETLQTTETFGVYLSSWETLFKQNFLKEPTPAEALQTTDKVQHHLERAPRVNDREDGIFNALSSFYAISSPALVKTFISDHRNLRFALFSALPKIKESFGTPVKTELRLIEDMEDNLQRLRVSIVSNRANARQALERFDEEWWLDHVQDAEGLLDFTVRSE